MLLPMGRQVVRSRLAVILDIKELATPSFSGRSHSGAHIPASAMVCVGAARNPWTRQDADVDASNSTPLGVVCQGVTDAICHSQVHASEECLVLLPACTPDEVRGL